MTRHSILSEELLRLSRNLEKLSKQELLLVFRRNDLIRTLSAMDYLIFCIGMDTISDPQAQKILHTLEDILHTRYFDFASKLLSAEGEAKSLSDRQELLMDLSGTIALCIGALSNRGKYDREFVRRYISAAQTIIRSLLPAEGADRIVQTDMT